MLGGRPTPGRAGWWHGAIDHATYMYPSMSGTCGRGTVVLPRRNGTAPANRQDGGSSVDRQPTDRPGQGENVIILCERCFVPIGHDEPMVRDAHPQAVDIDGTAQWVHSYRHLNRCTTLWHAPHDRPDTGAWDPRRGIGVLQTLYGPTA